MITPDGFTHIITPFNRSELEFVTLYLDRNRTVDSYFNVTSDLSIEQQREIVRQLGLKTPAFDWSQTVPYVYYESKSLTVNPKTDFTRFITTFEASHPLVQGAVNAFFEFRKELNITKEDIVDFTNIFDTKWAKKRFKLSLLDTVASFDYAIHTALQPLGKYVQLLTAKYIVENNLNPKKTKGQIYKGSTQHDPRRFR
ncbi:hypothetical protein QR680_015670 [Steinernema hermaphroditum]|uniref:Uncharacterized protein n=1 Tax=Steinernema hermaphroditum TaxID=289476 RepID=A0AA39LL61_9BILA|nr:hypothetical protein QR680_015670 [Steinernema hermaphroditum]